MLRSYFLIQYVEIALLTCMFCRERSWIFLLLLFLSAGLNGSNSWETLQVDVVWELCDELVEPPVSIMFEVKEEEKKVSIALCEIFYSLSIYKLITFDRSHVIISKLTPPPKKNVWCVLPPPPPAGNRKYKLRKAYSKSNRCTDSSLPFHTNLHGRSIIGLFIFL